MNGHTAAVKRVGLGLMRDRAHLGLHFDSLVFPESTSIPVEGLVMDVENARENVLKDGASLGIRATVSYGHRATRMVSTLAAVDPMAI